VRALHHLPAVYFCNNLNIYAVHRTKIESHETEFTTTLVPMQPSSQRMNPEANSPLSHKPLDVTCTELDLSHSTGTSTHPHPAPPRSLLSLAYTCHTHAHVTIVRRLQGGSVRNLYWRHGPNGILHVIATHHPTPHCCNNLHMYSFYTTQDEYYSRGLYRQYTNSSAFRDFPALFGGSTLANNPGYHLVCVSASSADGGHVMQDGMLSLRYQKKDTKDSRACAAPAAPSQPAAPSPASPATPAPAPPPPSQNAGTSQLSITLSSNVKGVTGVTMTVTLTPGVAVPSPGKILITLLGAGLNLAGAPAVAFMSPATGAAGHAAWSTSGPLVLIVTLSAGTFPAGQQIAFTIPGFTNPSSPQAAITNVASIATSMDGIPVSGASTTGTYPAISDIPSPAAPSPPPPSQNAQLSITLSSNVKGVTGVTMTVTLTPGVAVPSPGKILITLTGAGLNLAGAPAVAFVSPATGAAGTAALSGTGPFVLTVTLTGGTFPVGQQITFTIPGFTNPSSPQAAVTNVAAAFTTNDGNTIPGSGVTGTYPAITDIPSPAPAPSPSVVHTLTMELASADQKALQPTTASTSFTFTTTSALAIGGTITVMLPPNYFSGKANPAGTLQPPSGGPNLVSNCALTAGKLYIECPTVANVPAGTYRLTFAAGELTTGPAIASSTTGLAVKTSVDGWSNGDAVPALVASAPPPAPPTTSEPDATGHVTSATPQSTPSQHPDSSSLHSTAHEEHVTSAAPPQSAPSQGQMTFTSITVGSTTAGASVSPILVFTPATTVPIAGTITLTMPAGYFLGSVTSIISTVPVLTATSTPAATATSTTIVLTTSGAATGTSAVTVTLIGLILGAAQAATTAGFKMSSSADVALSFAKQAPAILDSVVTASALTLAAADQKALLATTAVTTVTFTTTTVLPSGGTITVTLPPNYFSGKANPAGTLVPASGTASLTSTCTLTAATLTIVCTTATADLPAGVSKITFAAGELTTGPANGGSSSGLTVKTSVDGVSAGAAVPALVASAPAPAPPTTSEPDATGHVTSATPQSTPSQHPDTSSQHSTAHEEHVTSAAPQSTPSQHHETSAFPTEHMTTDPSHTSA